VLFADLQASGALSRRLSSAAATAIEAAHELRRVALETADQIGRETGLFTAADCPLNVGVHWGSTLYMGQVVTGGRLEVTALGDEVNECARIQQSAREGAVLASKALIERLVDGDATRVGIDPQAVVYCTLAELPGADEKSIRDAGTLSVTELFADERLAAAA
jgi:class 3 adenylate cyclase